MSSSGHEPELDKKWLRRSIRRPVSSHRRWLPLRLRLEPLEARRLLAGINVSVYIDVDGSRSFDPASDSVAPNRLVYIDLDGSGRRDVGEPVAVTNSQGIAFFDNLPQGNFSVGLITNPRTQPQVAPVRAAAPELKIASLNATSLLSSSDLEHIWAVDDTGTARLLSTDAATSGPHTVELGRLVAYLPNSAERLLAFTRTTAGQSLREFDVRSGALASPTLMGEFGVANEILAMAGTSLDTLVLTSAAGDAIPSGTSEVSGTPVGAATLWRLLPQAGGYRLVPGIATSAYAIAGSPASELLLALSAGAQGGSQLELLNPRSEFASVARLALDGEAEAVTMSSDGRLALVTLTGGGVLAVDIDPLEQTLRLASILAEATGPVTAVSRDGRLLTASVLDPREIITWDVTRWVVVNRSRLPEASSPNQNLSAGIAALALDSSGDRFLALAGTAIHEVKLALPTSQSVRLNNPQQVVDVRLGVRDLGINEVPLVAPLPTRELNEDDYDVFDLRQQSGGFDADQDELYFTVASPPRHGRLESSIDAPWRYVPNADFNGLDSAKVLVHDGQAATELLLEWYVAPVNDPPLGITVNATGLPENSPTGTQVGLVTIADADQDTSYFFTTSDLRFEVDQGRLVFAEGWLDFETEPLISLEIIAVDEIDPSIVISTWLQIVVSDVNEEPYSIELNNHTVPENEPGAEIGQLSVLDSDASGNYEFFVFDSRFEVSGNRLRLAADVALDFATEPYVDLVVAATDGLFELFETFTIEVSPGEIAQARLNVAGNSVLERTFGATVGQVTVENPRDTEYSLVVSDPRFEIAGGMLRLRSDQQLHAKSEPEVSLTLSATGNEGDFLEATLGIVVFAWESEYHNSRAPADVNGDGIVSASDVLIVINDLNTNGTHPVPEPGNAVGEPPVDMPDVNGDGIVSPLDVILIINHLNGDERDSAANSPAAPAAAQRTVGEGELAAVETPRLLPPDINWAHFSQVETEKRNSSIDAELEFLLDQLSRQQHQRGA